MDVRCENCHVEYELPDSKLKRGGVTVKCVECGHMFKIRKRAATNPGAAPAPRTPANSSRPAPAGPPAGRVARRPPTKPPPGARPGQSGPVPTAAPASKSGPKNREWLIRLDDGEIMRCQELSTLQQWIVGGQVSRESSISRNGKTWKPLGAIAELSKYFDMAEKAARSKGTSSQPPSAPPNRASTSQPPPPPVRRTGASSSSPIKAPFTTGEMRAEVAALEASREEASRAAVEGLAPGKLPGSPGPNDINTTTSLKALKKPAAKPAPARAPAPAPAPDADVDPMGATAPSPRPEKRSSAPAAADGGPATGAWAVSSAKIAAVEGDNDGPRGPVGGLARGIPTDDVAFAAGNSKPSKKSDRSKRDSYGVAPLDYTDDDLAEVRGGGGGAGKWLVMGSLLVLAGAGAAIYFLVLKGDGDKGNKTAGNTPPAQIDAGATDPANGAPDAGPAVTAKPGGTPVMELASQAILTQDARSLSGMSTRLSALDGADKKADVVAMKAAVNAGLAQLFADRAADAEDSKQAKRLKASARSKALLASKLAKAALRLDRENVNAMVAMADALRVQGKSGRQVERWLRRALKAKAGDSNALFSRALLNLRDNKKRGADKLLKQLSASMSTTGDTRPQYRRGLLALRAKDYDAARASANLILAVNNTNSGAKSLLAKVQAATSVDTTDPMPPDVKTTKNGTGGGGNYDQLLKRANGKAESGNCSAAIAVYRRALDLNPAGIAALVGLGYCHLDKRQFASAHDKFRAALVISSRYKPALMGVAEAYQQQGLKPQAITAYKRVLAAHPSMRKQVERQVVKLGGKLDGGTTTKTPDPKKPDVKTPDPKKPDAKKPEPKKPDAKKPDAPAPKKPAPKPPASPTKTDDRTDG